MRRFFAAALLTLTGAAAAEPAASVAFEHCEIQGGTGSNRHYAQCAKLSVPETPDGSATVQLTVARKPATTGQSASDALVIINGGPGGASIPLLADYWGVFSLLGAERDVIAMDQRGTGASNPMHCEQLTDLSGDPSLAALESATQECLDQVNGDPAAYTTSAAVRDLETLRQALGYTQLTIYGVSYGTRVAQHYLRRFPQHTRGVILDGVVPPNEVLGAPIIRHSQATLEALFARCAEQPACNDAFGDLSQHLNTLRERFTRTPARTIQLKHPVTSEPITFDLMYAHVAASVRFMLYSPESAALIPLILHRAAELQDYQPIAAQAVLTLEQLAASIATGMQNSVMCTEDAPFFGAQERDVASLNATYLGADLVTGLEAICDVWPRGSMDEDLRTLVESDTPVLVLSGEHDPITPPAWGDAILSGLTGARHLVAPGQGHGVIARGCVPRLAADFVESLDADALDASCLESLGGFPFFIDTLGPSP